MEMMERSIGIWMLLLRRLVPRARSLPESSEIYGKSEYVSASTDATCLVSGSFVLAGFS